jgi:hypothetical protein
MTHRTSPTASAPRCPLSLIETQPRLPRGFRRVGKNRLRGVAGWHITWAIWPTVAACCVDGGQTRATQAYRINAPFQARLPTLPLSYGGPCLR